MTIFDSWVMKRRSPGIYFLLICVNLRFDLLYINRILEADENFRWCANQLCSAGQYVVDGGMLSIIYFWLKQPMSHISRAQNATWDHVSTVELWLIQIWHAKNIRRFLLLSKPPSILPRWIGSRRTQNVALAIDQLRKILAANIWLVRSVKRSGVGCVARIMST